MKQNSYEERERENEESLNAVTTISTIVHTKPDKTYVRKNVCESERKANITIVCLMAGKGNGMAFQRISLFET